MLKKVLVVFLASVSLAFGQAKKNLEYTGFFDSYYFRGPWSFSAGGSVALYGGDIAEFFNGNKIQPSFDLGIAYKPIPKVQIGVKYTFVNLGANDIQNRGLSFASKFHEVSLYGKYFFIEDIVRRHPQFVNKKPKLIKPYGSLGIAPVLYNSTLTSSADSLSIPTSGTTIVLPIGAGIQFDISRRFAVILDFNYRVTFTDKFDAYSPEGGGNNDSYGTVGLSVSYAPWAPRLKKKKFKAKKAGDAHSSPSGGGGAGTTAPESTGDDAPATTEPASESEVTPEESTEEGTIEEGAVEESEDTSEEFTEEESSEEESTEDEYSEDDYSEDESTEESEESSEEEYYDEGDGW